MIWESSGHGASMVDPGDEEDVTILRHYCNIPKPFWGIFGVRERWGMGYGLWAMSYGL